MNFPDKVFMQLNDTHPSLVIPELMRLLIDREGLGWDQAWEITTHATGYTNHTILPEALEKWPVEHDGEDCCRGTCRSSTRSTPGSCGMWPPAISLDGDRLRRMSIIDEDGEKHVRMAHLAIVGSCSVNGVAKLHSELLRNVGTAGFCRILARQVQQQDQRDHAAALAPQGQSGAWRN